MALSHGLSPVWAAVAAAPTPAVAVQIALDRARPADLAAPPQRSHLPRRAERNLAAAMRVLEIGDFHVLDDLTVSSATQPAVSQPTAPPIGEGVTEAGTVENATAGQMDAAAEEAPITPALRAHAASLRAWALEASHTTPPPEHLQALSRHASPPAAAALLLPAGTSPSASAALVRAASLASGSLASAVASGPAVSLLRSLRAAAPRDLVGALEALATAHPRAARALFVAADGAVPAAEALARVAGVLSPAAAADALAALADARWKEPAVRVAEALVARAGGADGVADALVKGLERNVVGNEKSLRFGKLLLAAVREVPGVKERHAVVVRGVAAQSKVFLAKRAVMLLPKDDAA